MSGPRTEAGRVLLAQEAYNSRSFPLITPEAVLAIEVEARVLDAAVLGMAMDMTDEEDDRLGVVGRGAKAERVAARYLTLMARP